MQEKSLFAIKLIGKVCILLGEYKTTHMMYIYCAESKGGVLRFRRECIS